MSLLLYKKMNIDQSKEETKTHNNIGQLAIWTAVWLFTFALAAFGPVLLWEENKHISAAMVLFNSLMGIGMIYSNRNFINKLDELQRKINMDAMAIALGAGVVGGLSYSMLDTIDLIAADAEISHLVIFISITYLLALVAGKMRYR